MSKFHIYPSNKSGGGQIFKLSFGCASFKSTYNNTSLCSNLRKLIHNSCKRDPGVTFSRLLEKRCCWLPVCVSFPPSQHQGAFETENVAITELSTILSRSGLQACCEHLMIGHFQRKGWFASHTRVRVHKGR